MIIIGILRYLLNVDLLCHIIYVPGEWSQTLNEYVYYVHCIFFFKVQIMKTW